MTISKETAARALGMMNHHGGNVFHAAHDIELHLTSIRPYTDRRSSAVLELLRKLSLFARSGDLQRFAMWYLRVQEIAGEPQS